MTQKFPLCFEITFRRSIQDNSHQSELRKEILQSQQQLLRLLLRLGSKLTFSIRYFYDPNQTPKIKTYLLINQPDEFQTEEIYDQLFSFLRKGKISDFFMLTPQSDFSQFQRLDWVNFIGEVLKHEEFIEPQNHYLPHLFKANEANDMLAVYDVINRLDNRVILEITLQNYQNSHEKQILVNAINQMVAQLDKVNASTTGNKDNFFSVTWELYQKYQQLYCNGDLFQYSIKALAENRGETSLVLNTLIEHATEETTHSKHCKIFIVHKDKPGFSESLQATKNVDISTDIEWEEWQKNFGQLLITGV
jgi:hypothetical protein